MIYNNYFADYPRVFGYRYAGSDDDDEKEEEAEEKIASENEEEGSERDQEQDDDEEQDTADEPDEHEKPIVGRYRAPLFGGTFPNNWAKTSPYHDEMVMNQRGRLATKFSTLSGASRQIFVET
jgi:hypothetical protein